MSSYTTEVRFICESYAGLDKSEGFSSIDSVIEKAIPFVFDFSFPIFDENYRIPLEKKILKHFYTREICEETVGLWKLRLEETLEEIMPYYNQLYKTQIDGINPYYNIDLTTDHKGQGTKDTDGTNTNAKTGSKTTTDNTTYDGFREHTETRDNDTLTKGTIKTVNYGGDKITREDGTEGGWSKNIQDKNTNEIGKENTKDNIKTDTTNTAYGIEKNINRFSDTPQGSLQNMTAVDKNNLYLTTATIDDKSTSSNSNTSGKETDTGEKTTNITNTGKTTDNYTRGLTEAKTKTETFAGRNDKTINSGTDTNNKNGTKDVTKSGTIKEALNENKKENDVTTRDEKIKTTEDYIEHVSGYKGVKSVAALIMEWRKSLINIDAMIMKDLEDCFFQLW